MKVYNYKYTMPPILDLSLSALVNFTILVGNNPIAAYNGICGKSLSADYTNPSFVNVPCGGNGTKVVFFKLDTKTTTLCEVKVFGSKADG